MKKALFLFISLSVTSIALCQTKIFPEPKCGWDSLQTKFKYSTKGYFFEEQIALRAYLVIDSTGKIIKLSVEPFSGRRSINNIDYTCPMSEFDSVYINETEEILRHVEWNPGKIDGINKTFYFDIPIIYNNYPYGTPYSQRRMIIVDTVRREIDKSYKGCE